VFGDLGFDETRAASGGFIWNQAAILYAIDLWHRRLPLLAYGGRVAECGGRPPVGRDCQTSLWFLERSHRRSWDGAATARRAPRALLGLQPSSPGRVRWTPNLIVSALQLWALEHGRTPVTGDWRLAGANAPGYSNGPPCLWYVA